MPNQTPKSPTCPSCNSTSLIRGVGIGQTAEIGRIGLSYRHKTVLGISLTGTAPLLADVCDTCGTVARLFVDSVGKDWIQQDAKPQK